jgi:hypothetical protein
LLAGLALVALDGGGVALHAQTQTGVGITRDVNDRSETFFQYFLLTVFGLFGVGSQTPVDMTGWTPPALLDGRPQVPIPLFGWTPPSQLQRQVEPRSQDTPLPAELRRPAALGRPPASVAPPPAAAPDATGRWPGLE